MVSIPIADYLNLGYQITSRGLPPQTPQWSTFSLLSLQLILHIVASDVHHVAIVLRKKSRPQVFQDASPASSSSSLGPPSLLRLLQSSYPCPSLNSGKVCWYHFAWLVPILEFL